MSNKIVYRRFSPLTLVDDDDDLVWPYREESPQECGRCLACQEITKWAGQERDWYVTLADWKQLPIEAPLSQIRTILRTRLEICPDDWWRFYSYDDLSLPN